MWRRASDKSNKPQPICLGMSKRRAGACDFE